jgi:predicted transposase/invertase (TIGR01784 family)
MFDNVCKFLAESFSQDFAQWLLGEAHRLTQLSPTELSVDPIRADALILLAAEPVILHLEFQTQPDPKLPFRMADYRLRMYRRYPDKPMRQVVIYLRPTGSELVQQTVFAIPGLRHEFEVIRLWEVPTDDLLRFPGLLPLAILSRTEDQAQTLREIAQRIEQLSTPQAQSNVTAATAILAGLVLEKGVIRQVLREELMRESVIYQEIVAEATAKGRAEGRAEGKAEGRAEGKAEGRAEGKAEGLQEGEAALVLRQLRRRMGELEAGLKGRIRALSLAQLEALGEALLDFSQLEDLVNWLQNHSSQ